MNILEKFSQSFGFTQNERRVILFLVLTFLIGGAIKIYKTSTQAQQSYNYASSDSEFAARSALIGQAESVSEKKAMDAPGKKESVSKSHIAGKININMATKEELMKLPGIGEATAEGIMNYREEHGALKSIDELMNIKGIGKKKLERITPMVTIGK